MRKVISKILEILRMEDEIINRVENSSLVQVSLDDFYPKGERILFDIKDFLRDEIALIEKEFRLKLKETNWAQYEGEYVGIICSADAIVPLWAFMLVASELQPFAKKVVFGNKEDLEKAIFSDVLSEIDYTVYKDTTIIVKGCGKYPIPESVVVDFAVKIQEYAKSIMFGEACSAVPLYKRKK
tara:strand:- start:3401 stop:3949 length:549 start_codon:yes stop_codon:yes gene_type:complete